MKLTFIERLTILNVLPQETNYATLQIISNLNNLLSFSEEEFKEYNIKLEGNKINWDAEKEKENDILIGEKAFDLIQSSLKKLNDQNKLTQSHLSLCDKFNLNKLI
jgi:hypothetical protein